MKKSEIIAMIVFALLSLGYRFQMPEESIESVVLEVEITIYVEGSVSKAITYDYLPTIKEVFIHLSINNIYGFDESYVLHDTQVLYIPDGRRLEELISLNTASKEELMSIPGIGPKTAESIISYRENTSFKVIEDIMNISGIGEKTYYKMREYLCL